MKTIYGRPGYSKLFAERCVVPVLLAACMFGGVAAAQPLVVQLLNGRNGKPVVNGRVGVSFPGQPDRIAIELVTNRKGEVRFDAAGAKVFKVTPVLYVSCGEQRPGSPQPEYSVDDVLGAGLFARNACGHYRVEPLRGRLVFFVRRVSGWELFKN